MKLETHPQVGAFATKHLSKPRANSVVQGQRIGPVRNLDHVMFMEGNHAARADRVGKLGHRSCRIGLIHENAATHDRIERASLWKRDIESTFDESEVRQPGVTRCPSRQLEHLRVLIHGKDMPRTANPACTHQRHSRYRARAFPARCPHLRAFAESSGPLDSTSTRELTLQWNITRLRASARSRIRAPYPPLIDFEMPARICTDSTLLAASATGDVRDV
jgi:hypothetical protein